MGSVIVVQDDQNTRVSVVATASNVEIGTGGDVSQEDLDAAIAAALLAAADLDEQTVDNVIGNIFDLRTSVRAVSTTNISLNGEQTVGGVALVDGDLMLAKGQTDSAQNGIYAVAAGAWSRWTGADEDAEVTVGMTVHVNDSDSDHDQSYWVLLSSNVEVGVDGQAWSSISDLSPLFIAVVQGLLTYARFGSGSPEGVVSAPLGAYYVNSVGGAAATFWVKESGGTGNTGWSPTNVLSVIEAHIADTSAAHAASAISFAGSGGLSSTDVEGALDELDAEKEATGTASTAVANHVAASDPHTQYQKESEKDQANGYAGLTAGGLINEAQLPALAIGVPFEVASQAAMLALAAQRGDVAIRSDLNKTFMLASDSPSTLADWKELRTPTDAVLSVMGRVGAVDVSDLFDAAGAAADAQAASAPKGSSFVTTAADAGLSAETPIGSIILAPDVIANRPAANTVPAGAIYISTDTKVIARSTGAAWVVMVDLSGTYAALAGATFTGQVIGKAGTAASPAWGFTGETNTGLYLNSANRLGFAIGGVMAGYVEYAPAVSANGRGGTFLGYTAGQVNNQNSGTAGGYNNTFIGGESGQANTTGYQNTFIGSRAGFTNIVGKENTFIGQGAGYYNTGNNCTTLGFHAGLNMTGSSFVAVGSQAAEGASSSTATAGSIVCIGTDVGKVITTGDGLTGVGHQAGTAITSGQYNTFVGYRAGFAVNSGGGNVLVGRETGKALTTQSDNVHIGKLAGTAATGAVNTLIGSASGLSIVTGTANTFIGYQTGYTATGANATVAGTDNVFIGHNAGAGGTGDYSSTISIGSAALTSGAGAIAIGRGASAGAGGAVAIGRSAAGSAASTTTADEFKFGVAAHTYNFPGSAMTLADALTIAVGTSTGTKIGTATGQKLGFWNATPVVQQVLATGAGATVDNVITLLQTLGLCKQS